MVCTAEPGPRKGKRPRSWEEIRLAAAQQQGCVEITYAASFGSVDELGSRWGQAAKNAGRHLGSPVHCVGDGAQWLVNQNREVFGSSGSFTCDFYHVSEYLAAAAPTCRPERCDTWRRTQQKRLKGNASKLVEKELTLHLEPSSIPEEQAPVRQALRYLRNRADQLNYKDALDKNLPIGSGMIESAHKHVIQGRLKLAGCAWAKRNANLMAQLSVVRSNGAWDSIWRNFRATHF